MRVTRVPTRARNAIVFYASSRLSERTSAAVMLSLHVPRKADIIWNSDPCRYRLGVRTHDSQSWDRGSIPRTGTTFVRTPASPVRAHQTRPPLRAVFSAVCGRRELDDPLTSPAPAAGRG